MSVTLDYLKTTLDVFFEQASKKSHQHNYLEKEEQARLHKEVYLLQKHITELQERHKINLRLDSSIYSHGIANSFDNPQKATALTSENYEYHWLKFLALREGLLSAEDLNEFIDEFVEQYENDLTFQDIVINKTGPTRCKNNIRLCTDSLRKKGVLHKREISGMRSVRPTVPGFLILIYIKWKVESVGEERNSYSKLGKTHPWFNHMIAMSKTNNFNVFIEFLRTKLQWNDSIKGLIREFTNAVSNHVTLENEKIRIHAEYYKVVDEILYSKKNEELLESLFLPLKQFYSFMQ